MKKAAPILVILLLIAIIVVITLARARQLGYVTVYEGNTGGQPVQLVLNHFQDTQCGMLLVQLEDAAQAVAPDGRTWFFDDVGCLALWLQTNRLRDQMRIWVHTRDSGQWVNGRTAWYSRNNRTLMEYGFAAQAARQDGCVDFDTMYRMMLRGENLTNPYVRKELLGND